MLPAVWTSAASTENGPDDPYYTRPGSEQLVSNLPPPRDQGELAFCYAAVPAVLLDRHRCRRQGLHCPELPASEQVSMLDLASAHDQDGPSLHEFGNMLHLFHGLVRRVRDGQLFLARESCMPYAALDRLDMPERPAHLHLRAGWSTLHRLYIDLREGSDPRSPAEIRRELANRFSLPAPAARLEAAVQATRRPTAPEFERFAWEVLHNPACRDPDRAIAMPGFRVRAWPPPDQPARREELGGKIGELLDRDLPVSISYCARWEARDGNQQCLNRAGHASVVVGRREACHRGTGECQWLYKLLNSFGSEWNQREFQVWVPADALLDATIELRRRSQVLIWLE